MERQRHLIEKRLIDQLCSGESQWTYRPDLRTEEDLWNNFKYILEQNNKAKLDDVPLSELEFAKVKNDLSHASFYDAGKWLVGENGKVYVHVQRGNETLHLVVMNNEHVAGGSSVYEVINQYQAFKDATIGSFFEEKYIENFATDCGNWDIEIINEQDRKFHFGGSLCTDLVYRQEALSLLLREFIEMPELLGFDGDIRNEIHVDEGEYIFVEVSFESSEKTYCYICDDKLIQEYDEVLVPVGQDNIEKVAIVESVEVHTEDDAPYPVEKCKHVIKRLV